MSICIYEADLNEVILLAETVIKFYWEVMFKFFDIGNILLILFICF